MESVQVMLAAAIEHGAISIEGEDWVVTKWPQYQDPSAERQKRYRAAKSRLSPLRHRRSPLRDVTFSLSRATETVTEQITDKHANACSPELGSKPGPTPKPVSAESADVRQVYEYWVEKTKRSANQTRLTPGRRTKIETRLKRFAKDDLLKAIDGVMLSEFHSSKPEYLDLTSCFGSDEKVEQHIARSEGKHSRNGNGRSNRGDNAKFDRRNPAGEGAAGSGASDQTGRRRRGFSDE